MFFIIGFSAIQVFGSGFQINENGARAMGMSGAFVGLANDPSAVYFNPAGITQLAGARFSFGATYIRPNTAFTGPTPATTESKLKPRYFTPANFYFTYDLGNDFWLGFGFQNPYGNGIEWEDDWVGRYKTTKMELKTYNFSPTFAYKISEKLSIAAGVTVSFADVIIARKVKYIPTGNPANPLLVLPDDANIEMTGDNTAIGYSAGLLYKPTKELSVGLSFHSNVKYDFKGDAVVTLGLKTPAAMAKYIPFGKISAPFKTPYVFTAGLAYHANDELVITGDFQYTGWKSYDKLEVTFADYKPDGKNPYISTSVRDYQNSFIARLGAEYILSDQFTIRGGGLYDKNPIKDERLDATLPDADRFGVNVGLGVKLAKNVTVDIAYLFIMFKERTINTSTDIVPLSVTNLQQPWNGKYKSSAHLFGLNFNYNM